METNCSDYSQIRLSLKKHTKLELKALCIDQVLVIKTLHRRIQILQDRLYEKRTQERQNDERTHNQKRRVSSARISRAKRTR